MLPTTNSSGAKEKLGENLTTTFSILSEFLNISAENKYESAPHPQCYHDMTNSGVTLNSPMDLEDDGILSPGIATPVPGVSSEEIEYRLPVWEIWIMIIGYVLVFIFGVIGNVCVIIVVARLQRMKSVTNYFICNLAIADLLVLFFCLVPNLISNIYVPWMLGSFVCKTVPYIQGVSVCASVYSLVAISVERCISIQFPFAYQITKRRAKKIMVAIWFWSCLVALPWALFFQSGTFDPNNPDLEFCIEIWPEEYEEWSKYYFLIGNVIICYALPLVIICVSYLIIRKRVYCRPVPNDSNHKNMEKMHEQAKLAVTKMFFVVVLIFGLFWLPLYIITLIMKFKNSELSEGATNWITILFPMAQWLGSSNSSVNPIIYSFLNKKFRNGFERIFKCKWNNQEQNFQPPPISPAANILLKRMEAYKVRASIPSKGSSV